MTPPEGPWYKQFWLWFILTPLALLVMASFYLLFLAIVTSDGVIVDNYYKDGRGYVLRTEEDEFARNAQLDALLSIQGDKITVKLTGELAPMPEELTLYISHPTSQNFDITRTLTHRGLGQYTGDINSEVTGRRILQLQPVDSEQHWRLHFDGEVSTNVDGLELQPRQQ